MLPSEKLCPLGGAKKENTGTKHKGNWPHTLCPDPIFPPLHTLTKKMEKGCQSPRFHFHSSLFRPGTTPGLNMEGEGNRERSL